MDRRPREITFAEQLGLEPEEALALLIMLDDMNDRSLGHFKKEIQELQDIIASREVEKMLGDDDGN